MRKGFTLVELLAVIVILAIILAIAIPGISSLIDNAKKSTFENNAKVVLKSLKIDYDSKMANNNNSTFILYENGVKTTYPSSNNIDFTFSATDGGIVIHEDGTITMAVYDGTYCVTKLRNSNDVITTTTTKESCISNIYYKQASAPFTNSVTNGDFSNGKNGWDVSFSTISVSNNTLSMTATGGVYYGQIYQVTSINTATNPKVYVSGKFMVNDITSEIFIQVAGNSNLGAGSVDNPTINKYYSVSDIISFTGQTGNMVFKPTTCYTNSSSAMGKTTYIKDLVAINLTSIYGSSNEPTKDQMDNNINKVWIDSTTSTPKHFTAGGWVAF